MNADFPRRIIFLVAFICMKVYLLKNIDNVIRRFDKGKGNIIKNQMILPFY